MKKNSKKKKTIIILLIVLLTITIGYAVVLTQLKLVGTTLVTKQRWNVYWTNPTVSTGSVSDTLPTISDDEGNIRNAKAIFSANLELPGDYYEFTIDAVNAGTADAMISDITMNATPSLPNYIKYTMIYDDGCSLNENQIFKKADGDTPTVEKYKIRVEYDKENATAETINNMQADTNYTFTLQISYQKATDRAVERDKCIKSCPGCVFAYYTDTKYFSDYDEYNHERERSTLEDYVTSYEGLKKTFWYYNGYLEDHCNENEKCIRVDIQIPVFLGHVLDEDGKIKKGYLCHIKDDTPYCIEGEVIKNNGFYDTEIHKKNIELVEQMWNQEAYDHSSIYFDDSDSSYSSYITYYRGDNTPYWYIDDHNEDSQYSCYIYQNGSMNCY